MKKEKPIWDFNKSIFKNFTNDNEELLKKCFEQDMSCSRIGNIIKSEDDLIKTKHILWNNYRNYKNCYKYYASLNPIGEIFCI